MSKTVEPFTKQQREVVLSWCQQCAAIGLNMGRSRSDVVVTDTGTVGLLPHVKNIVTEAMDRIESTEKS